MPKKKKKKKRERRGRTRRRREKEGNMNEDDGMGLKTHRGQFMPQRLQSFYEHQQDVACESNSSRSKPLKDANLGNILVKMENVTEAYFK